MFKDYYKILGISVTASKQDIKNAYRRMSLKWHPDKNPNMDVTEIMQDINEAYKILSNEACRNKYDKEYKRFTERQKEVKLHTNMSSWDYNYNVKDEELKEDIFAARTYAKNLVEEFLKDLKTTSKIAAKGAWEYALSYIYAGVIFLFIVILIRMCN